MKTSSDSASRLSARRAFGMGLLAMVAFGGGLAQAQSAEGYPNKPVRLIVPFAAGGPTDMTGRAIGDALSRKWGQPVVIENRAGAGGTLGAGVVAKSPADGYTLLLGVTGSHGIAGALYSNLPYDPQKDFEPVARAVIYANAIVVSADVPAKNLQELIALIKRDEKYQVYGTDGNGTASHLTMELLKQRGSFKSQAVQYKGAAPMLTDLAAGHVKVGITGLPSAEAFLKTGKIRMIAVTTDKDYTGNHYPTVAEQGFPGFAAGPWSGIFAPKGTPKAIVDKISKDVAEAVQSTDVKKQFATLGLQPMPANPEEFARSLAQEIASWAKVVKDAGVKAE
ncbi:MAG: tripartite tricarboxylate transporter substrate binding protein [Comamonadaceae bacterium]|nr:tripartite tricarboxylate transporter substrate binding protein [Comamonadaceae bacterium]